MIKKKYKNYEDLTKGDINKENRQLFGRKNTLKRQIDTEEQINVKIKIKSLLDVYNFSPKISIHTTKKKGNLYYRGKINFGKNKPKQKQIPRSVEIKINNEIYEYLKSIYRLGKQKFTDEQKDILMKDKMKEWLLEWWREEGIMKRR